MPGYYGGITLRTRTTTTTTAAAASRLLDLRLARLASTGRDLQSACMIHFITFGSTPIVNEEISAIYDITARVTPKSKRYIMQMSTARSERQANRDREKEIERGQISWSEFPSWGGVKRNATNSTKMLQVRIL